MLRRVLMISCLVVLSGCGLGRTAIQHGSEEVHGFDSVTHSLGSPMSTTQTFWVLDGISVINTQKTLDDHLVSWISGDDCSTLRAMHGEPYCQPEPAKVPMITRTSYCYKNLAGTTCYTQPLPGTVQPTGIRVDKIPATTTALP